MGETAQETAEGEKLTIAMTAPNVPMTDRRLNIPADRRTSECFMIVSMVRNVADLYRKSRRLSSSRSELSMS